MRRSNQFQKKEDSLEESKDKDPNKPEEQVEGQESTPFAKDVGRLLRFIESVEELEEIHLSG